MGFNKPRFRTSAFSAKHEFRHALTDWFSREGKDYPWRRTTEPYAVLVSEIMLQQTQIATVLGKHHYTRFLEKFPDLAALARADDESLLKAWEGLGYYRRARMLRETARAVLDIHHGIFPHEEAELLKLPGIGPYTAAALRAFCFRQPSGLVDGNVSRIFARMAADPSPVDSSAVIRKHRDWALDLCDPGDPATYQHAIMELGQTICRPGRPACERCPIASFCACSEPEELPRKKPPAVISEIDEHALFCRDDEGLILLHQESGSRRNGMWKLPLRSPCECAALEEIYSASYMITRYRVSLRVFLLENSGGLEMRTGDRWVDPDAITALPFATPYRKALNRILENH